MLLILPVGGCPAWRNAPPWTAEGADSSMYAALAGLLTGLSLIVAIGAQNAYVLRLGLTRAHVGPAVAICAVSDALLIAAGVGGIGAVVTAVPSVLEVLRWLGVVYLVGYAVHSFRRAASRHVLLPADADPPSRRGVVAATLAFTWLNPHVYLDTVLLLGSLGNTYGADRWLFAAGAMAGSMLWFTGLGYSARAAARWMARPVTWRVLDAGIGVVMLTIAATLAVSDLNGSAPG